MHNCSKELLSKFSKPKKTINLFYICYSCLFYSFFLCLLLCDLFYLRCNQTFCYTILLCLFLWCFVRYLIMIKYLSNFLLKFLKNKMRFQIFLGRFYCECYFHHLWNVCFLNIKFPLLLKIYNLFRCSWMLIFPYIFCQFQIRL